MARAAAPPSRSADPAAFLSFEGGEGAGKSTQIERLRRRIAATGREVVATREPGGSPRAERIRDLLLSGAAEAYGAFALARALRRTRLQSPSEAVRTLTRGLLDHHAGAELKDDAVVLCLDWTGRPGATP